MSSPIDKQPAHAANTPVCTLPPEGWACSRVGGHDGPCAASPANDHKSSAGDVSASRYGFGRAQEFDLELPSGGRVRFRKPNWGQILDADLGDVVDGFSSELLKGVGDNDAANEEFGRALMDRSRRKKILTPLDRIAAISVICPKVVLDGETTDEQINAADIDIPDKMTIFFAAVGEQIDALKSGSEEPAVSTRNLPESQDFQPATQ